VGDTERFEVFRLKPKEEDEDVETDTGKTLDSAALAHALAAPFDQREVRFKPGVVRGNRALALCYVDARAIQDRLDEVVGVMGWQDEYECLPDGSVVCRLQLRLGEEWITKMDVGSQSEQPDEGDRRKAAFSDALKRAAVKFGIGRYLYRLPQVWCDYDPQKRQFVRPPALPDPARTQGASPSQAAPVPAPAPAPRTLPATGLELEERLVAMQSRLVDEGLCQPGDLVRHVLACGEEVDYPSLFVNWPREGMARAKSWANNFWVNRLRQALEDTRQAADRPWSDVTGLIGVKGGTRIEDLSREKLEEAIRKLRTQAGTTTTTAT
jgi:hypothetical protein